MNPDDTYLRYYVGAAAIGGTLLAVGVGMWWLKKKDEKSYPFFKDANPTRETKLPSID